jgi:hypothetical protein
MLRSMALEVAQKPNFSARNGWFEKNHFFDDFLPFLPTVFTAGKPPKGPHRLKA